MNNDRCFLCLVKKGKLHNFCTTCKLKAHLTCWIKYIKYKKYDKVQDIKFNIIFGENFYKDISSYSVPFYINCPMCKSKTNTYSPITRSKTKLAKLLLLKFNKQILNKLIETTQNYDEKQYFINKFINIIKDNKYILKGLIKQNIIKDLERYSKILKNNNYNNSKLSRELNIIKRYNTYYVSTIKK